MTYALEHVDETKRLERQSTFSNYQVEEEFKNTFIEPGQRVLDAGCGSGLVSRFIANKFQSVIVDACDCSELRVAQAKSISKAVQNNDINFFTCNLENIEVVDHTYDHIVCRYVYEHLANPLKVSQELFRLLKPGGKIHIVDLDGIFLNVYSSNECFNQLLEKVATDWESDLYIGRKIPSILKESGFNNIKWNAEIMTFADQELNNELELTQQRLEFLRPALIKILDNEETVDHFSSLYCQEIMKEECTMFYNKFVVQAIK